MSFLVKWLGRLQRWPHWYRFHRASGDPMKAQLAVLREILSDNASCEYGRKHGFDRITTIEQYRKAVPVVDASDMAPYIERMTGGEAGVLTTERPHYYCCTSGTTGKPKFNAVTGAYRRQWQRAVNAFVYRVFRDHPRAADGRILYFVGSNEMGRTADGTPYGTMSGYNYNTLPALARRLYAVPYEVFQVPDLELKYYTLVLLALRQRLSFLVAITPTPLITVARTLLDRIGPLVDDLRSGGMARLGELPRPVARVVEPLLAPDPARADELASLDREGRLSAVTAWPDIALISCWTGAAAGMYVPELKSLYPGVPLRDAIYSATEGWCNVPLLDGEPGGPLAVNSHFFEFIPEEEYESPGRRVLTLDELEEGRRYFILLTTGGGCYRYDLKDVVEVCRGYGRIPGIRFAYKGRHCCNLAGEKMSEGHFNEALAILCGLGGRRASGGTAFGPGSRDTADATAGETAGVGAGRAASGNGSGRAVAGVSGEPAGDACGNACGEVSGDAAAGIAGGGFGFVYFAAVPRRRAGDAGYDLYVEPKGPVEAFAAKAGSLGERLDVILREVNWEYGSHRECGDLAPLRLKFLAPGTWAEIRSTLAPDGGREAQVKPPHLTEKKELLEILRRREFKRTEGA